MMVFGLLVAYGVVLVAHGVDSGAVVAASVFMTIRIL